MRAGNLPQFAMLLRNTISDCAPYLSPEEKRKLALPKMHVASIQDKEVLFEQLQDIKALLLEICSAHGVYAYMEPEAGDASEFALGDDEAAAGASPGAGGDAGGGGGASVRVRVVDSG